MKSFPYVFSTAEIRITPKGDMYGPNGFVSMLRECCVIHQWPKSIERWWFQTLLVPSQTCSRPLEEVVDAFIIGCQIDGPISSPTYAKGEPETTEGKHEGVGWNRSLSRLSVRQVEF